MRINSTSIDKIVKIVALVAIAAALAAAISVGTTTAPASSLSNGTTMQPNSTGKADRLPVFVKAAGCFLQGWPNYEQDCLFDQRPSSGNGHGVRMIGMDRQLSTDLQVKVLALR